MRPTVPRHALRRAPAHPRTARRGAASLVAVLALLALLLPTTLPALAAGPSPAASAPAAPLPGGLRMTASAMLGGVIRPGAWSAIRVHLENDGPAVSGELHVTGGQQASNRYGAEVELATGARQDHVLYAQPSWTGRGLTVSLADDTGHTLLSQPLTTLVVDQYTPSIVIVAEHPESLVGDLRAGTTAPFMSAPTILTVNATDLPPRVEAWSAIDRLVWQDVDVSQLDADQLDALRSWVTAGGRLTVVGGSTGITTLGALPPDLLPYQPAGTVDVSLDELTELLGPLPAGATPLPGVAGLLQSGTILARAGDQVVAAQRQVGQGSVTIVGIDPSASWLKGSPTATGLWRRLLPPALNGIANPLVLPDDSNIVGALANLPSVDLPDLGVLFGLLLLYIALIGPLNYLVLRRLDRREWAWITMPVLVAIFAVAAWGLGATLKGTDTIVNQLGILRGAAGSDTGIGQYWVGIFSPARATYDVKVADAALLTNPVYLQQQGQATVPLDVLTGERSRLRDFQVGFAVLRTFRAEAGVAAPRVDAALTFKDGVLEGTVTNASDRPLEALAVTWAGAAQPIGDLAPGASAQVHLPLGRVAMGTGASISDLVFGPMPQDNRIPREQRSRRMVLDQLWWSGGLGNGPATGGPMIIGWAPGPGIGIDLGSDVKQTGDTLLLDPAPVAVTGPSVWPNALMSHAIVASQANEATDQGYQLSLGRGTMTVELRPVGFGGTLEPTKLSMMLTQGDLPALTGAGKVVEPLPADQQPAQDDPLGGVVAVLDPSLIKSDVPPDAPVAVAPGAGAPASWDGLPDVQLYDRTTGTWQELPHATWSREFSVADPARYVDDTGAVLVRFVNRGGQDQSTWFAPLVRLEGIAG
ncbi:MAG: hypothetical protein U0869_05465 [Chloroflexota bacterium]